MSFGRVLGFIAVFLLVVGGGHYYLWARLVRDPGWSDRWTHPLTGLFILMPVVLLAGMLSRNASRDFATPIAYAAFIWLGAFFLLFMGVLAWDMARGVYWLASKALPGVQPISPERRAFFARLAAWVTGGGSLALGAVGMVSALSRVKVKHVPVTLRKLAREHDGFTIVQLTDVHVGPTIGRGFIEEVVQQVNALDAHAVVITGDLVDGSVEDLAEHVAPLGNLRAKHGVFFVTGNHEYYSGAGAWVRHLTSLGIRVLRNEHVDLGAISMAGVDDMSGGGLAPGHGEDVGKALLGRAEAKPVVLLAHQPRVVTRAARHGVDLQLSGHTHGGQIVPWNFFVRLQQPYVAGLFDHLGTQLYVSKGTGYWGPPMRVGAPAEITRVVLHADAAA